MTLSLGHKGCVRIARADPRRAGELTDQLEELGRLTAAPEGSRRLHPIHSSRTYQREKATRKAATLGRDAQGETTTICRSTTPLSAWRFRRTRFGLR